jgi:hypothetical protein
MVGRLLDELDGDGLAGGAGATVTLKIVLNTLFDSELLVIVIVIPTVP